MAGVRMPADFLRGDAGVMALCGWMMPSANAPGRRRIARIRDTLRASDREREGVTFKPGCRSRERRCHDALSEALAIGRSWRWPLFVFVLVAAWTAYVAYLCLALRSLITAPSAAFARRAGQRRAGLHRTGARRRGADGEAVRRIGAGDLSGFTLAELARRLLDQRDLLHGNSPQHRAQSRAPSCIATARVSVQFVGKVQVGWFVTQ